MGILDIVRQKKERFHQEQTIKRAGALQGLKERETALKGREKIAKTKEKLEGSISKLEGKERERRFAKAKGVMKSLKKFKKKRQKNAGSNVWSGGNSGGGSNPWSGDNSGGGSNPWR